jgi:hypothetical protein
MPQYDNQPPPPVPEPELAFSHLAVAILVSLVHDLQAGSPKRRKEARASVAAHVPEVYLDLLDLGEAERARVLALLQELAF